ncbi:hypothetical protein SERLA73DRAFT_74079 [Serpula lacrymans var. lacrymans S7.3]|uniref:Uncharacterized protein n=2 Tax=Serpula lacrymans var. lacrymans TaxID=341189 RepID=F8Q0I6_SERL3|nr:uncharacterized protein SERLADRAFT_438717 [Serpula lacrymans var. lacrymans S7.9]EGN97815.1 hypothetical protein SERLA73DRAFT_74079 [Serpula lacrymans var. lacrymans S7.3]EGO23406.1 hypothetical protein SERLADRAFT_438717 [Serpula lacrymans var. lacrymans S7.9]
MGAKYLATLLNSTPKTECAEVAQDISNAIFKTHTGAGERAEYNSKEEQEVRMQLMFEKWLGKRVWTAASTQVHAGQLEHIKNGCLMQTQQDVSSDGSRIEGSHKGWNHLMRSFMSGIEMFKALGHDHVLRRNICINYNSKNPNDFITLTHGTYHLQLVNNILKLWNILVGKEALHKNGKKHLL